MDWIENIELYEDAQRRQRYCQFKLGLVKNRTTGQERGCKLRSESLKAKLSTELDQANADIDRIAAEMKDALALHSLWANWLEHIKGIGPIYAYRLIGSYEALTPVATIRNPSQAWRVAGVGIVDGRPQSGRKKRGGGQPAYGGYYPLRRVLGEMASRIVRLGRDSGSFYRAFYDAQRGRYEEGGSRAGKAKPHAGAILDMKRLIVSHMWACWRDSHGLSVPPSYAAAFDGHYDVPWTVAVAFDRLAKANQKMIEQLRQLGRGGDVHVRGPIIIQGEPREALVSLGLPS